MTSSYNAICNLIYHYADRMDRGRFEHAAELFRNARIKSRGGIVGHEELLAHHRRVIHVYEDGTPRVKHIVSNLIVEVDEAAGTASARSNYQVLQEFPDQTIRIIAAGRYHDEFERVDGAWRFSFRDYTLMDLKGDLSRHVSTLAVETASQG